MKLAVIGAGQIVQDFLPHAAAIPGLELAAVYGRPSASERLEELRERFGIGTVYVDYDECLADPDIDTVWIALPNSLHMDHARRALLAGKHVICEKPFVLDEADLAELRELATERDLILVEAISTQYLPNFEWIAENLAAVGSVKVIQSDYSQYSSRYDAFRRGETPPAFDPSMGGGALLDIGIYTLHFIVGLLGDPIDVRYTPNLERGVDTSGVLVLTYESCTAVCVCAKDSDGPIRTKIQGTDGSIVFDGSPNVMPAVVVTRRGEGTTTIDLRTHDHRMVDEFIAFERMIATHDLGERDRRLDHSQLVLSVASRALRSAAIG